MLSRRLKHRQTDKEKGRENRMKRRKKETTENKKKKKDNARNKKRHYTRVEDSADQTIYTD